MGNRERLVRAAADLFREQGYAGTSVEDLLVRTGVARSNFYYHFDSKLDVAREIASRWASGYHETVAAGWEDSGSDRERRLTLRRSLAGDEGPQAVQGIFADVVLALAPHDPEIRASASEVVEDLEARMARLVGEDGGEGAGAPSPVARAAASALLGSIVVGRAFDDGGRARHAGDGLDRLISGCDGGPVVGEAASSRDAGRPGRDDAPAPGSTTRASA